MNRLADADSLYLRQHADNPVDWWPWCDEALAEARRRDCPVLLSIGYAACHWCHVMAHESFADAAIAAAMNARFVCIKLDREQRPDLDRAYQRAQQALSGRPGGWPLTAFLDPHTLLPIFIGTYFPPQPRHGLPAFGQLLTAIATAWRDQRDAITAQGAQWHQWLAQRMQPESGSEPFEPLARALQQIEARFDRQHGGHQGAPKFPQASELELLLDVVVDAAPGHGDAETMLVATLDAMARGGLRDQLDGGFFRYCVDAGWGIPHFEKMLYDNAQLLPLYARAARVLDRPDWAGVARDCAHWMHAALGLPGGGLASALDADSPGGEGAFYVWTRQQLADALPDPTVLARAVAAFELDAPPNFESHAWHLHLAQRAPLAADRERAAITDALRTARAQRPSPARDDKQLTACNALACAGLYRCALALEDVDLARQADAVLAVLRQRAWRDGVLYAQADSAGSAPGFLDDYAYTLDAVLEALACRWRDEDFAWALALRAKLVADFADTGYGGFFFSGIAHATPLGRERSFEDASQPSGNAVAAAALLRLGHLCGEATCVDIAERTVRAGLASLAEFPAAAPALLRVWRRMQDPPAQLILRANAMERARWEPALATLRARAACMMYVIAPDADALPPPLAARGWRPGGVAYWCEGFTCRTPITRPGDLPT